MVELGAGVGAEQPLEVGVDGLPGGDLLSRVLDARNWLAARWCRDRNKVTCL